MSNGRVIINTEHPDQPFNICANLPPAKRQELIDLLKKYKHAFAWTPTDMVGVNREVIEHKLMIKPGTKVCVQGGDGNKEINVKVAKLNNAGILREAIFPTWIANPVMVKKHDGTWHMCVDYSDLNKACPKDYYPYQKWTKRWSL